MEEISLPQKSIILITGATGYTGRLLTRKLVTAGHSVRAIAREGSDVSPLSDLEVQWFRGVVSDETLIQKAMVDVNYVFHLAAAFRDPNSTIKDYSDVHLKSTQLIVSESLKQPAFKKLVHVSTIGVHSHIDTPPATESYRLQPDDDYQKTKADAEIWLNESCETNPIPYTIIRPCGIYGPGEGRFLKMFKMALWPLYPILGSGQGWLHLVHVEDLTNAMILAAKKDVATGETFIIGSSAPIRNVEMAKIIAETLNKKLRVLRIPIQPFFILGGLCEAICKPLGINPPIYRRRVAFYSKDRYFSVDKMKTVLGYEPQYENKEGIIDAAKWYREHNWL